jgi:hypothetical protein
MTTDDLVTMLATGVDAVDPRAAVRRYAGAVGVGVMAAAALMAVLLGVNPHLLQDVSSPMGWAKFAFVAALLIVRCARRCASPGRGDAGGDAGGAHAGAGDVAPRHGARRLGSAAGLVLGQTAAATFLRTLATPVFLGGSGR